MALLIAIANSLAAAAALGFAATAVLAPTTLTGSRTVASTRYYAGMYAARALPVAGAVFVVVSAPVPISTIVVVLVVAGAAQVGDMTIGIKRRIPGMVIGAGTAATIHLTSAAHLLVAH